MIIHNVEQGSPDWFRIRAGMPTASNFKSLITSKGERSKTLETYAITLAGELFAGKPLEVWEGNQWTERGKNLEADAIRLYEFAHDTTVERVGFVTDNGYSAGCSPDGFVGNDGLVEIKCLKPENHVKAILTYQESGTAPTDYIAQTQGQMLLAERKWCDLIFYHPDLPLLVIRQKPIDAVQNGLIETISEVRSQRDKIVAALHKQSQPQKKAA